MKTLRLSIGKKPLKLGVFIIKPGKDVQIYLGGGASPHIGSIAISQPRPSLQNPSRISCTTSVFNLLGHKDNEPAVLFAEGFCKKFNCTTVVSAGIHFNNATPENLEKVMGLVKDLLEKSLKKWDIIE